MKDALKVLFKALQQYSTDDPAAGAELSAMLDYLGTLINTYYIEDSIKELPADQWDPQLDALNLFHAHLSTKYLSLMYASDDSSALFSDNTEYIRLIIYGDVDISVSDGSKVLKEIRSDGTQLVDGEPAQYSFPYASCFTDKVIISFPADQSYKVTLTSRSLLPQTISYTGLSFSGHTLRAQADNLYSYIMNNGDTAVIKTSVQGKAIEPEGSAYTDMFVFTEAMYSPTTAMRMENNRIIHLNISGFINNIFLLIIVLLAQLAVSIILLIRRKKKHLKRNITVTLVWHSAMAFIFTVLEIAMWFFVPVFPVLKAAMTLVVFIVIFAYAMKGCREQNRDWKLFWKFSLGLAAFMVLQNLLIGSFAGWKGILLLAVYGAFMTVAYLMLWHKKMGSILFEGQTES